MNPDKFNEEISTIENEKLDFLFDKYYLRSTKLDRDIKRYGFIAFILVVIFYSIRLSVVTELDFMNIKVADLSVVLKFIPFLVSYFLFLSTSRLNKHKEYEIALGLILRKKYNLLEDSEIIYLTTGVFKTKNNQNSSAPKVTFFQFLSSLFILWSFLVILAVFLWLVFFLFYFVIAETFAWYYNHYFEWLFFASSIVSFSLLIFTALEIYKYFKGGIATAAAGFLTGDK